MLNFKIAVFVDLHRFLLYEHLSYTFHFCGKTIFVRDRRFYYRKTLIAEIQRLGAYLMRENTA